MRTFQAELELSVMFVAVKCKESGMAETWVRNTPMSCHGIWKGEDDEEA